ncbi:DUF4328 domain-containing protein [Dactylosporangium sp. AC04546]|uniref:DUF4328 domain-containing protein n=1 Tax=Dactylosporangium sp. AC04546 TaxID=2862460 RepID=UPI0021067D52|nr:DUF4328 domain-containing protein [Dactylosporangium sp. AC04546]WVK87144.1 DUF4328 domain-containing protein [Dactylosporangium sp. AC04546]
MNETRIAAPHRLQTTSWVTVAALAIAGLAHAFFIARNLLGPEDVAGEVVARREEFGLGWSIEGEPGLQAVTVARVLTLVVFIVWLYLAHDNFGRRDNPLEWRKGWVIAGWFVPVANLVIPGQVVKEVYRRSYPEKAWSSVQLVSAWWMALLVTFLSYTNTTVYATPGTDATVTTVYTPAFLAVITGGAGILAAVLGIIIVRRVSVWQDSPAAG